MVFEWLNINSLFFAWDTTSELDLQCTGGAIFILKFKISGFDFMLVSLSPLVLPQELNCWYIGFLNPSSDEQDG